MPARVLYCESNVDGTIGGSHYCLLYLIENLDRSRFEPIALFYQRHALIERFKAAAETIVLERRPMATWASGPYGRRFGLLSIPVVLFRRAVNTGRFLRLIGRHIMFLRRRQIDLVHLNNSVKRHHDWMVASLIAGVPCVTHERGLNDKYSLLDRLLGRRLALIVPASRWIQDHMVRRGMSAANIRVIYDGVDPNTLKVSRPPEALRAEWNLAANQPVVGIVGNIREWKGQEIVVRALIEVVKVHPSIVCFFVGAATPTDKPYEDRLRNLIEQAGIESNVRFTGYQRDVPSFVNMMDFVIHASIQPEPFGMVVLEAMAQRKAVIGSGAGGIVEMVVEGETGYTFPPADSGALAARMLILLADRERSRQMGERGYRRLISSFTVQGCMNEIHAAYRAILSKSPVPSEIGLAADTQAR